MGTTTGSGLGRMHPAALVVPRATGDVPSVGQCIVLPLPMSNLSQIHIKLPKVSQSFLNSIPYHFLLSGTRRVAARAGTPSIVVAEAEAVS